MSTPSAYRSDQARAAVHESYGRLVQRWPVAVESRTVETTLGRAHALVSGAPKAPPLVLLHGGSGNATMWIHNVAALAAGLRVYALDIVGDLGRSEGARPSNEAGYVEWLGQVLDGLGLERPHLAGASSGAWLAAAFARRAPQRVDRLALLAPPHLGPLRAAFLWRAMLASLLPGEKRIYDFYKYISSHDAAMPPAWAIRDMQLRWRSQRAAPSPPKTITEHELRALPAGTLLLVGRDEPLYDLEPALARVRAQAPRIDVTVLPAAGHVITIDRADEVSAALLDHCLAGRDEALRAAS